MATSNVVPIKTEVTLTAEAFLGQIVDALVKAPNLVQNNTTVVILGKDLVDWIAATYDGFKM